MKLLDKFIYEYISKNVINPIKDKYMYFHDFVYQYEKRSRKGILYFIRKKDDELINYILENNPVEIFEYLENRVKYKTYNSGFNQHIDCMLLTLLKIKYPEYLTDYLKSIMVKDKVSVTNPIKVEKMESSGWSDLDTENLNNKINELKNNIRFWDV